MGAYWTQPNPSNFLFDETHVLMSLRDFHKLYEYSTSVPSGVYEGKMWKKLLELYDPETGSGSAKWLLVWYGNSKDPNKCSINRRKILIA